MNVRGDSFPQVFPLTEFQIPVDPSEQTFEGQAPAGVPGAAAVNPSLEAISCGGMVQGTCVYGDPPLLCFSNPQPEALVLPSTACSRT